MVSFTFPAGTASFARLWLLDERRAGKSTGSGVLPEELFSCVDQTPPASILASVVRQHGRGDTTMGLNVMLWLVQGLLALLFLFAGGMKLVLPLEALAGPVALPGFFLRFIGVAEVLGAIGLILPGLLRIRQGLTPLAAAGLVIIMTGATVITAMGGAVAAALVPLIVGLLAASVAYGRWRLTAYSGRVLLSDPCSPLHPADA
jgi:hypothetical protein